MSNDMDDLIKIIANADIESMKDQERKAFLINAYNISVIKGLVDSWPIDNPLNIEGFFEKEKHNIGGEKITLNEIENEKENGNETCEDTHVRALRVPRAASFVSVFAFVFAFV